MRAMLLAAGLGTRMAPISEHLAKAALPVLGTSLLERALGALAEQGVERAVVNAHRFPEQVRAALARAPIPVQISYEPELRGSGGGILAARRWLEGPDPILVLNADMCIELDVGALLEAHAGRGALATLVLRDETRKHEFGTIGYAEAHRVSRITNLVDRGAECGSGLFAGVHVIESELFALMPKRAAFDILRDVYVPLLASGEPIGAWLQPPNHQWWPVGTPRELLDANLAALRQRAADASVPSDGLFVSSDASISGDVRGPAWIAPGARVAAGALAGPQVVIGPGATLGAGATARETLLLANAEPATGVTLERAIGYEREVWRDA